MKTELRWILYAAAFAGFYAFAVNYTGWFSRYLLLVFLLLPILSLLCTVIPAWKTAVSVSVPDTAVRGGEAFITVSTVKAPLLLRLPVIIGIRQENMTAVNGQVRYIRYRFFPDPDPAAAHSGMLRIPIDTSHTALICTSVSSIRISDPMGLFSLPIKVFPAGSAGSAGSARSAGTSFFDTYVFPTQETAVTAPERWKSESPVFVPVQGFSEQSEIRSYRPGDPMRSVHWKLSAKTDGVLVREPVEHPRTTVGLTFDRTPDSDEADILYDGLACLICDLLREDGTRCVHAVWVTADGTLQTADIRTSDEIDSFFRGLLTGGTPALPVTAEDMRSAPMPRDAAEVLHLSRDLNVSSRRR